MKGEGRIRIKENRVAPTRGPTHQTDVNEIALCPLVSRPREMPAVISPRFRKCIWGGQTSNSDYVAFAREVTRDPREIHSHPPE